MNVQLTNDFIKIYKKRFSNRRNFKERFDERVRLFSQNPSDSILNDHELSGKLQGYRAFSITGDVRVIYYIFEDTAYLVDIGTHNQVYGK